MNEDMQLLTAVKLAKQGDTRAFEELYRLTYRYAYFHAKSILKDEDEAWDLVQETYIIVYQNIQTLRDDRYIQSWIGGIIFNLGHKKLRKKTDVLVEEDGEFLFENIEDGDRDLSPEEALDSKETVSIVWDVIESLPSLQKAAVIAYYFDEKSIAAIAEEAMCSQGTIKSRLNYARKTMKDAIEQRERQMGVRIHTVTGPVIILVLRKMFMQLPVSERRARNVLWLIENHVGLLGTAAGAANQAGQAAAEQASGSQAAAGQAAAGQAAAGQASGSQAAAGRTAAGKAAAGNTAAAAARGTSNAAGTAKLFAVMFGTVKMRIVTLVVALIVSAGGFLGTAAALNHKKPSAPAGAKIQSETEAAEPETETTEAETTEAEPEPGWIETDEGWKYMEEDRSFTSHTWKEIDGELYYFKKDGLMADGDVYLGRQVFSFNISGVLIGISAADGDTGNTVCYDEGDKYYVDGHNIMFKGEDGTEKIIFSLPEKIFGLSVDGDMIYFNLEQDICSVKTDGTEFKKVDSGLTWMTPVGITAKNGEVSICVMDLDYTDADPKYGGVFAFENGKVTGLGGSYGYPAEYGKLQISDHITYYVHSINEMRMSDDPDEPYSNVVFRSTDEGVERVTGEGIEEYFVYGDTIYFMQNGRFGKQSISEATRAQREERAAVNSNPTAAYQKYVNDVLIPQYGKFNSFHVEYGYGMTEYGFNRIVPVLEKGIISTHIEDMDFDGVPELMVFYNSSLSSSSTDIYVSVYRIVNGEIHNWGSGVLCTGMMDCDINKFRIFIKDFGDKKVIGGSYGEFVGISGDGSGYEINLYQIEADAYNIQPLLLKRYGTSSWFEVQDEWVNTIRQQGFEVTANEWAQEGNEEFLISENEPNCKILVEGDISLNVSIDEFCDSGWYDGQKEGVCPYKVIGDIIVHN